MKLTCLSGLVGSVVLAVVACGGDDRPKVVVEEPNQGGKSAGTGGKGGKGGSGGSSSAGKTGNAGGDGGMAPLAEEGIDVRITAPAAASDPNNDEILVEDEVTVVCTAKSESADATVDGSSVVIDVLGADGKVALGQDEKPLTAVGVPRTDADDAYSATFVLTRVATGEVSFRCSAASVDKAAGGKDEVSTFIDHGPTIVAKVPEADSPHPLKGTMPVEFRIVPSPLSEEDDGAEVTKVTLSVAGVAIEGNALVQDKDDPRTYRAEVDFTDQALFKDPPPEHTSVHIEATNARRPKPVTAVNDYAIVVDGKGPDIEYVSPQPNATVHGETVVQFTAVDSGAGVDLDTVELSLTGVTDPYKYEASKPTVWTKTGNTFKFRFDSLSAALAGVAYQINVTIRAKDAAGNLTDGKVLVLNKDDYGPSIDLDPGNARGLNSQKVCSVSFDPLYGAVNDLDQKSVTSLMLRALVYDRTNTGSGGSVYYMSGTDRSSVRLYIQPNPAEPLLKDTNGDGTCDDLTRENYFSYVSLAALERSGSLDYGPDGTTAPPVAGLCSVASTSSTASPLCNGTSDMSAVVQHDVSTGGDEPVVYAFAPSSSGFECTGKQLDLHPYTAPGGVSKSGDGWVCLAVKAKDIRGNTTVSRPLRLCLDDPTVNWPGDGRPGCMKDAPPPSCVDACTPPSPIGPHIYRH